MKIDETMIPDESVEVLREYFDTTHSAMFLREVAAAVINAWPGADDSKDRKGWWFDTRSLILPLPKEDRT
jgi:hypothetical protein